MEQEELTSDLAVQKSSPSTSAEPSETTSTQLESDEMNKIWKYFMNGVESFKNFMICFYGASVDYHQLQRLSERTRIDISSAETETKNCLAKTKANGYDLLLKRKEQEEKIENGNARKLALKESIKLNKENVENAKSVVKDAESNVNKQEDNVRSAMQDYNKATETAAVNLLGGGFALGVFIFSGGLAAPFVATGAFEASIAVAVMVDKKRELENAKRDLSTKTGILQEHKNELGNNERELENVRSSYKTSKQLLEQLQERHNKLLERLKEIQELQVFLFESYSFISKTLGNAELIAERRKDKFYRPHFKLLINKAIQHLSTVTTLQCMPYSTTSVLAITDDLKSIESNVGVSD